MSAYGGPSKNWVSNKDQGRHHVAIKGVLQTGLIFNLDTGTTQSYPGTGTTWTDLTASPLNATIQNGTYGTDFGGSFTTANTAPFAYIGALATNSKLSLTQNFTIEQVFKPTGYQASNYYGLTNQLLIKGTASTYNYATQLTNDTTVSFIKRSGAEALMGHNFTVPSMLNRVIVLTFVISSNTTVLCYMNGSLIGSLSISGAAIAAVADDPTYISPDITGSDESVFKGIYYSCRVYNIALTASQVSKNFNALRRRYGI